MTLLLKHLTTTHGYAGRTVRDILGIVTAKCVPGVSVFRDLLTLRNCRQAQRHPPESAAGRGPVNTGNVVTESNVSDVPCGY